MTVYSDRKYRKLVMLNVTLLDEQVDTKPLWHGGILRPELRITSCSIIRMPVTSTARRLRPMSGDWATRFTTSSTTAPIPRASGPRAGR